MGDLATLTKARRELEDLYLGVPDDSVNLTFQDLVQVQQQQIISLEKKNSDKMELISQVNPKKEGSLSSTSPPIPKLPSLNFNSGLQASSNQYNHQHVLNVVVSPRNRRSHPVNEDGTHMSRGHRFVNGETHGDHTSAHSHHRDHHASPLGFRPAFESSVVYDDISHVSGTSMASMNPTLERGGRRRHGIPHSNICTICSTYIYIFRHRCLVCGRAYCRHCVSVGMGEMTEGRKCIECLGKKFSQRYIQRAGQVGCCMWYPSTVKQQELKWAEKGPRRSSDNIYRRSGVVSRSPMTPRSPTRAHGTINSASFVMNSPYSPFSPTNHPLPL